MRLRYLLAGAVLGMVIAAVGIAAAVDDGDGDDSPLPTSSVDADESPYAGLSLQVAIDLAEEEGREWRIAREDDEVFALTDDLVAGRVTFEVDNGVVTAATIEVASLPDNDIVQPDEARADLIADALRRLVTEDNSFGGRDVFAEFRVGTTVGRERPFELSDLDRDFITAALSDLGEVTFIADVDAEIDALFGASPAGIAVVAVDDLLLLDDRAEAEVRLWCGSLCGVFVTYEAVPDEGGWLITGTSGPIAIS